MARRPLPPFIILWNRHTQLYLEVFSLALQELAEKDSVTGDEDAISETLCLILSRVCYNAGKSRNQEVQTPYWEAPIQPAAPDELKDGKSRKRPDFTCKCLNPRADSPEEYEISFHVECKLLGYPTSVSWNLNKNYVENGLKRFDCNNHQYGKRAPSGMLIGYIISMTPEEIETEVNGYQKKHLPHYTDINFMFNTITLFRTHQKIERRNVRPVQFELFHLWVDLRNNYQTVDGIHTL
ncbi:MAG: hypothetical protein GTO45_19260 [Candidatus Aminicenantes bacterium]|nr:hypothetical protein [Candidatus Aminicenantes bacterium]NIM80932.1 hypothetical protein [Candidatus Aminicenantes bacterium]NIN20314.1 hypothetical protein [Candidatus Aminicenantes bacterium]NIN44089.1 hypothetical protein [Candidatus Aminicenantes bacterium]NIN86901.1 hypothetical protein [Candidatus Aminicenantes bacterium]